MTLFKKITLAIFLSTSCSAYAQTANEQILKKALAAWQPIEVKQQNDVITIIFDTNEITSEAYNPMIVTGVCPPLWSQGEKGGYLKSIKEIHLLNKHAFTGLVFENPKSTCADMGQAMPKESNVILFSNTRQYKNPK